MTQMIDLHTHSTASDGTFSPAELVQEAKRLQISAIALTDHDSVNGITDALAQGECSGVEVIPGIELSTTYGPALGELLASGKSELEIHVVGLFIDPNTPALLEQIRRFVDNRDNRNLQMIDKLCEEGFRISAADLYRLYPDSVVARPHIARYLADTGQIKNYQTAFDKYIGDGCKCFVDRIKITPMDAVRLVHESGGIAILAHPCLYDMKRKELVQMLELMVDAGLDGMEVKYSCNKGSDEKDFTELANRYGLLLSGGSDFHGSNKTYIHLGTGKGNLKVPYEYLQAMKERLKR